MLKPLICAIVVFSVLFPIRSAAADAIGPDSDPLHTLKKSHPRLIVMEEDLDRVRKLLAEKNPDAIALHDALRKSATHMLEERPVEYKLIGPRLLDKSRTALRRITTLAALYRLDGDKAFADRAIKEMLTVSDFADWHPPHFLDTAEMTAAVALGYDWLYDVLTPGQRKIFFEAIRDKGLKPGLLAYEGKKPSFWTTVHHNWAQVCGGGLSLGALDIGDEEPQISSDILKHIYKTVLGGMEALGPDGGCPEGPGYWAYATQYNVYCLAGLESALGTDWGLGQTSGFPETGLFPIETTGPTDHPFNYSDAPEGKLGSTPQLYWMARHYNRPEYAAFERTVATRSADPFALFWFDPAGQFPSPSLTRDAIFGHINVACFRGAWADPNATFVGFKGGNNRANHSHLDLGTFVLDALGQRWAIDLGGDDYNLPAYFGSHRWDYYRLRTEGHNTLLLDGENQNPSGTAPLIAYSSTPERALAVADLTRAYRANTRQVLRGIELLDRKRVVIEDEVESDKPLDIVWNFHTRAKIQLDGDKATLTQETVRLEAKILAPANAKFEVISANPPPPQRQQPDIQNLVIRLAGKTTSARIIVLLTPISDGEKPLETPKVEPLAEWIARGPLAGSPATAKH
jgi:hypothetical protein